MGDNIYLVLENGKKFSGKSFGAKGEVTGEVVFNTGMASYLETITDPNYYGQIVAQTFPIIGNYGVIPEDTDNRKPRLSAYIVKHWCEQPSNFRSAGCLDSYLKSNGIVGLYGIDTRTLTKIIREEGVMNGRIMSGTDNVELEEIKNYKIEPPAEIVGTKKIYNAVPNQNAKFKICIYDYGLKQGLIDALSVRDCDIIVIPPAVNFNILLEFKPNGIVLSNGPGNPAENPAAIRNIRGLLEHKIPMLGVGMGHQLLALAKGLCVQKMNHGHRGDNQPVRITETGQLCTTSQNHSYCVDLKSLKSPEKNNEQTPKQTLVNVNDQTCEGIEYTDVPAMSVQFNPEARKETVFLLDKFISMMQMMQVR